MTLKEQPSRPSSNRTHKIGVACSGAIGAFGLGALALELPISTAIISDQSRYRVQKEKSLCC